MPSKGLVDGKLKSISEEITKNGLHKGNTDAEAFFTARYFGERGIKMGGSSGFSSLWCNEIR